MTCRSATTSRSTAAKSTTWLSSAWDDAEVGEGALVAAGSVVLSKTKIGPHEMWAGAPAKFVKMMEPEKSRELNEKIARNYLFYSKWYTDPDNAPL